MVRAGGAALRARARAEVHLRSAVAHRRLDEREPRAGRRRAGAPVRRGEARRRLVPGALSRSADGRVVGGVSPRAADRSRAVGALVRRGRQLVAAADARGRVSRGELGGERERVLCLRARAAPGTARRDGDRAAPGAELRARRRTRHPRAMVAKAALGVPRLPRRLHSLVPRGRLVHVYAAGRAHCSREGHGCGGIRDRARRREHDAVPDGGVAAREPTEPHRFAGGAGSARAHRRPARGRL